MIRPLAGVVLLELRLWSCLARWATGRYPHDAGFRYDRGLRLLIHAVIGLLVIEGAIVDLVLEVALPGTVWVWVWLGVHVYALLSLLGLLASWAVRPHLLDEHALRLRDGIVGELVIPYARITDARPARRSHVGRSGLKITGASGLLAFGDTTVELTLDPDGSVALTSLAITVDTPHEFVDALRESIAAAGAHSQSR